MAGAGYKNFAPGEVLTSSDVDNYLMEQSVMVFAGTAARGTTLTSPAEGMFSYRTDADALEVYNGTAWVPAAQAAGAATVTNRNLLYNGAMQVSQRGTSTTGINSSGYYAADRWQIAYGGTFGAWTQDIQNDAPSGSGLTRSSRILCTTADAAPAAGDVLLFQQVLEGQDLQRLAKGTASAKTMTLSFWVKSNVTGTYVVWLMDNDNSRSVSKSYTISASATWEKKIISVPADSTGAFDNDNAGSLLVRFGLGAGSTYTSGTLGTTWAATTNANTLVGQTNLAAATNNYWQVTGVQLETGDVATDFEFKSYGQELRECQRYYFRTSVTATNVPFTAGQNSTTTLHYGTLYFPVDMRTNPTTIETSGTASDYHVTHSNLNTACSVVPTIGSASRTCAGVFGTVASGLTAGQGSSLRSNSATAYLGFTAEL